MLGTNAESHALNRFHIIHYQLRIESAKQYNRLIFITLTLICTCNTIEYIIWWEFFSPKRGYGVPKAISTYPPNCGKNYCFRCGNYFNGNLVVRDFVFYQRNNPKFIITLTFASFLSGALTLLRRARGVSIIHATSTKQPLPSPRGFFIWQQPTSCSPQNLHSR